jgi:hypothetical protein
MMKALTVALATAGVLFVAVPSASAAPRLEGITQDLSAATVKKTTVVRRNNGTTVRRTVVRRSYSAPTYYGYYGPTYYERPYVRPAPVVFSIGGWW